MMASDKDDSVIDISTRQAPGELSGVVDMSNKITRLKCFKAVYQMILDGQLPRKIATAIKDEYGECKDDPLDRVTRMVRDYRSKVISEDLRDTGPSIDIEDPDDFVASSLTFLLKNQLKRLKMESATEEKLGKLFSTTHKEVGAAVQTAMALKKCTGNSGSGVTSKRVPGVRGRLPIGRILDDPEKLRKVMKTFESIIDDPGLVNEIRADSSEPVSDTTPTVTTVDESRGGEVSDETAGDKEDKARPVHKKSASRKKAAPKKARPKRSR